MAFGSAKAWDNLKKDFADAKKNLDRINTLNTLMKKWGVSENYAGIGHCILGYAAQEPAPAKPRKADFIVRVDRNR